MGQIDRAAAANLHGLARVQRERRWIAIMDTVLAFSILLWIAGLTLHLVPTGIAWVLPLLVCLVGAHRVLVTVERQRRERSGHGARPDVRRQLSRAGG